MLSEYPGPMTVDDFFEALSRDREFFREHGITRLRAVYLYFYPCDEHGQGSVVCDRAGNPLAGYISSRYEQGAPAGRKNRRRKPKPEPILRRTRFPLEN